MGILDAIKGQLIDVIEWTDNSGKTMVHKYDTNGKEITMGAQLTVRESQAAIFVNEGELADVFGPGRYELSTSNMPILTALKSWKYGFNSPFKSDVYFVNTKQFLDMKWGTSNPVMMRDAEFGLIRLRAFGVYRFKVEGQIKRTLVSGLSDAIAESKIPALDLAANYDELASYALKAINPKIAPLGLTLCSFVIENISLPEEVEKSMDKRTSMGVLGNLDQYAKYQAAEAMRDAATNGNGMAGMGVGMGAGAAMGQMFAQSMNPAQPAAPAAPAAGAVCSACGAQIPAGTKFCPECGAKQAAGAFCTACGAQIPAGTKFCPECGAKQ